MSFGVMDYVVISLINLALMFGGAATVIWARHSLSPWRLNKPTVPVNQSQVKP